jgi:hypothetical protein
LILLASFGLSACSSTADESAYDGAVTAAGDYGSSGDGTAGDHETAGQHGDPGGTGGGDGTDGADEGEGSGDGGANDDESEFAGCPARRPETLIFCEDFESLDDPASVFFEYQDGKGAFALVDDMGASGTHSMEATYLEGEEAAGWLSISFGESPILFGARPHHAENLHFDEVYWRVRMKTEAGWPDVGPGRLMRAMAFAKEDWGQAMTASLGTVDGDVRLSGQASTCVIGEEILCQGYNDPALAPLGTLQGTTELFSNAQSGKWHCIEAHVKLNTPGQPDGVFEFWVDGVPQDAMKELDWRGSWTDYGLNLVSIENFWTGGAPGDLIRWIDDIAIATAPIGCD